MSGIARVSSSRRRRLHTAKPEVPGSSTRSSTSAGGWSPHAREGLGRGSASTDRRQRAGGEDHRQADRQPRVGLDDEGGRHRAAR